MTRTRVHRQLVDPRTCRFLGPFSDLLRGPFSALHISLVRWFHFMSFSVIRFTRSTFPTCCKLVIIAFRPCISAGMFKKVVSPSPDLMPVLQRADRTNPERVWRVAARVRRRVIWPSPEGLGCKHVVIVGIHAKCCRQIPQGYGASLPGRCRNPCT